MVGSLSDTNSGRLDRTILLLEVATIACAIVLLVGIFGENKTESKGVDFRLTTLPSTRPVVWNFSSRPSPAGRWHGIFQSIVEGSIGGEIAFGLILVFANRRRASADKIQILELKERLSPRNLSEPQISALHAFALAMGEQEIDVVVVGGSSETKRYASLVRLPLVGARWRAQLWSASPDVIEPNISVFFSAWSPNPKLREIAEGLVATFISAGIPCKPAVAPFTEAGEPGVLMGDAPKNTQIAHIKMFVGEREDADLEPNDASPT